MPRAISDMKARLPQRPPEHVRADQSRMFLQRILPPEWILRDEYHDYGIDVRVEIVEGALVTGREFVVQLKAPARLDWNATRSFFSFPCATSSLRYYLARPEPVLLIVYDVQSDQGYSLWVQDYLRHEALKGWQSRQKLALRIPADNVLNSASPDQIAQRTLEYYERSILLQGITSGQHDRFWEPVVTFRDSCTTFGLLPRYPGAEEECPLVIEGTFQFDDSPEGREAYRTLRQHFATGAPVQLNSRFLGQFRLPQIIERLLPVLDWQPTSLTITSAPSPIIIPLSLRVLDAGHRVIGELPYIPVHEVQRGTDELTLESISPNPHSPQRFLSFQVSRSGTSIKARQQINNQPIRHLLDFFRFQTAMCSGASMQLVNLETGATLHSPLSDQMTPPDESFVSFLDVLAFIEETTGHTLRWPGTCTKETARVVEQTAEILRNGRLHQFADTVSFAFPIENSDKLQQQLPGDEWTSLALDSTDAHVTLFGEVISLGPARTTLPQVRMTQETRARIVGPNPESTKGFVRITLEVGQAGAETTYSKWPRTDQA